MNSRRLHRFAPVLLALLFGAALWLLHRELRAYDYHDIRSSIAALPYWRVLLALLLTIVSYGLLIGYDALALRHLHRDLPYRRTALASFLGYSFSHNIGLSVLGGAAPRYRLYSTWGLSTLEITTLIGFASVTFWLGAFSITAPALLADPVAVGASLHLPVAAARPLGIVLLLLIAGYVAACALRKTSITIGDWEFFLPKPGIAVRQVILSTVDWSTTAAVLYVLLPSSVSISYGHFLAIFVVAQVTGVVSHVPGGLGVFETIVLLALNRQASGPDIVAPLIVFRTVYYLLPLCVATALLALHEAAKRREHFNRLGLLFGRWVPEVAPRLLSVTVFIGGAILLFSGVVPASHQGLDVLDQFLPLPVLELSHFLGSLAGLGLMLLSSGLQRRLDAAYHLSAVLLAAGAVFALLRGLHYVQTMILAGMLAALIPCRRHFYRRASVIGERFTPGWSVAVIVAVAASVWLGMFAHKHVEYAHDLWWQFSLRGDAPRFLRASVGVIGAGLFFAVAHLLSPSKPRPLSADPDAFDTARAIVRSAGEATANLALLGDKHFLFSEDRHAMIMYGVSGRSWVSMGDPVGPMDRRAELVWLFRELCDRDGAWPVFYEARAINLPLYLDVGLVPLKFGEEARVSLEKFTLEGSSHKQQRYVLRNVERRGGSFEMLPPSAVPAVLPELRAVSDVWLTEKHTREKSFSLGRFDPDYLAQFPVGIVRVGDQIVAFSNLWCSAEQAEVSPDLMRYRADSPESTMEYLFLQLILWAQRDGYRWFNLGMAPLSGLEARALAPLWQRIGAIAFRYGEQFYNFQGLRQFKNKFEPDWHPKYLVCPGGIVLPRVLANVASLVSGGLKGVVSK